MGALNAKVLGLIPLGDSVFSLSHALDKMKKHLLLC